MKKQLPILIAVVCLLVAAAGVSSAAKATNQRKAAEAENETLLRQIADLKTRPSRGRASPAQPAPPDNTSEILVPQDTPTEENGAQETERPPRESFTERMARMKEEDPEGYAEMVKRREERQQAMQYDMATRTATIMDLDTSKMNEAERETHEQLVLRMGTIWELMAQMQNPEEGTSRETMGELFNQIREARPLMDQERTSMFRVLGAEMGYEGPEAEDFATHIESIISATTIQMPRSGGRGR